MKSLRKYYWALALLLVSSLVLSACGGDDNEKELENKQDDTEFLLTPFIPYMEWGGSLANIKKYMSNYSFWTNYQQITDPALGPLYIVHVFDCTAKYPSTYAKVQYNFWDGVYRDVMILSDFGTLGEILQWADYYRTTFKAEIEKRVDIIGDGSYDDYCTCTVNGKPCQIKISIVPSLNNVYYGMVDIGLNVYGL